jgi:hypothetical protein
MFRSETEKTTDRTSTNFEDKQDFVHRYEVSPRTDYEERPPIPYNLSIFKVKPPKKTLQYFDLIERANLSIFKVNSYYKDEEHFGLIERAKPM